MKVCVVALGKIGLPLAVPGQCAVLQPSRHLGDRGLRLWFHGDRGSAVELAADGGAPSATAFGRRRRCGLQPWIAAELWQAPDAGYGDSGDGARCIAGL